MTTFITWDKTKNTQARQSFENITGFAPQTNPQENKQETHFMVGVKITLQQYQSLNETELFTLKNWQPPYWWEHKSNLVINE